MKILSNIASSISIISIYIYATAKTARKSNYNHNSIGSFSKLFSKIQQQCNKEVLIEYIDKEIVSNGK